MNEPAKHGRLDIIFMSDPDPVILENWASEVRNGSVYLDGNVYGHKRIADGTRINTAAVTCMLHDVGIAQTTTINYILRNRR